jgi:hypothetical protein
VGAAEALVVSKGSPTADGVGIGDAALGTRCDAGAVAT